MTSQGDLYAVQRAQVNREQDFLRPGAILPSKRDENINEPTSNDSEKKELQMPKKREH